METLDLNAFQPSSTAGLQTIHLKSLRTGRILQDSTRLGIWFGTRRPVVQIHSPRPFYYPQIRQLSIDLPRRDVEPAATRLQTAVLRWARSVEDPSFAPPQRLLVNIPTRYGTYCLEDAYVFQASNRIKAPGMCVSSIQACAARFGRVDALFVFVMNDQGLLRGLKTQGEQRWLIKF